MKIIKGDTVKVIIGKDKNRTGEVISVSPKKNSVLVKGLNIFKKHIKATKDQKGGIIEKERSLTASKVMVICPSCKKTTRVAYQLDKAGTKTRICRHCKSMLSSKVSK
jgi:large subunit ribosomal protein L24